MILTISQWVLIVIIGLAIAVIIQRFVLFIVLVSSNSMEPTLAPGDRVLMVRIRRSHNVKRQDIIAFYSREYEMMMIKRAIGLPGDSVTIQNDGVLYINGKKLTEDYVHSSNSPSEAFNVPKHQFILLGDNRKHSSDSRFWEQPFIADKDILGKAVFIIYPFRRMWCFRKDKRKSSDTCPTI